jgi:acyl carrier protein
MESSSSSTPSSSSPNSEDTLVRHFPAEVRDAYGRFRGSPNAGDADVVVLAVVRDYTPDKAGKNGRDPADSQRLIEDLGFDSIAITEMVFFLEDLFRVKIGNEEILRVRTVGDLRAFIREKLAVPTSPSRA